MASRIAGISEDGKYMDAFPATVRYVFISDFLKRPSRTSNGESRIDGAHSVLELHLRGKGVKKEREDIQRIIGIARTCPYLSLHDRPKRFPIQLQLAWEKFRSRASLVG